MQWVTLETNNSKAQNIFLRDYIIPYDVVWRHILLFVETMYRPFTCADLLRVCKFYIYAKFTPVGKNKFDTRSHVSKIFGT